MKTNRSIQIIMLIFSAFGMMFFASCDKDTTCKLDVQVVRADNGMGVKDAHVTVGKQGATRGAEGYSDSEGHFSASFSAPAIFDVYAEYLVYRTIYDTTWDAMGGIIDITPEEQYQGKYSNLTSVRLKDGETVDCTLKLDFNNLQ